MRSAVTGNCSKLSHHNLRCSTPNKFCGYLGMFAGYANIRHAYIVRAPTPINKPPGDEWLPVPNHPKKKLGIPMSANGIPAQMDRVGGRLYFLMK